MADYANPTSPTSAAPVPPETFPVDQTQGDGADDAYVNPTPPTSAVPPTPAIFPVAGEWSTYDEVRAPTSQRTSRRRNRR